MRGMMRYYNEWKFKHPTPDDFKRIMEKESGLELDWYFEQFIGTTNSINYAIVDVDKKDKNTTAIELKRIGEMPMPLDVSVTLKNGDVKVYNIPLQIMRGEKTDTSIPSLLVVSEDWAWTNPTFTLCIDVKEKEIEKVEIDASMRMADTDREDNVFPKIKK